MKFKLQIYITVSVIFLPTWRYDELMVMFITVTFDELFLAFVKQWLMWVIAFAKNVLPLNLCTLNM